MSAPTVTPDMRQRAFEALKGTHCRGVPLPTCNLMQLADVLAEWMATGHIDPGVAKVYFDAVTPMPTPDVAAFQAARDAQPAKGSL